jgi:hypothetical protein
VKQPCQQTVLARGTVSEVVYCRSCRVFHVNVDALTVHFHAEALRDLRDTLSAALAAYDERVSSEKSAEPAISRSRVKMTH